MWNKIDEYKNLHKNCAEICPESYILIQLHLNINSFIADFCSHVDSFSFISCISAGGRRLRALLQVAITVYRRQLKCTLGNK